ncbi:MAG: right-handed parallel beta-helix repeat-containing protein [Deltaproteobacteria bacterium]|nr:right-handed parallel beta-helix repeat-containing protein [Deltaproteobacteria bacterium]
MKKSQFLSLFAACIVQFPGQFEATFAKFARGECKSSSALSELRFLGSMDVYIKNPLVLEGGNERKKISALAGTTVRLIGSYSGVAPGMQIKTSQVEIANITFRDFSGSAIEIRADDVSLRNNTITHNGSHGVVITDGRAMDEEPTCGFSSFASAHPANILLEDNQIYNNEAFGILIEDGYPVQIQSKESTASIHDNPSGAIYLQSTSAAFACLTEGTEFDPMQILPHFMLSGVSIQGAIVIDGPSFPTPRNLAGTIANDGGLDLQGAFDLQGDENSPWDFRYRFPQDLKIEIYAGPPEAEEEGHTLLATVTTIQANGSFRAHVSKENLPFPIPFVVTAVATNQTYKLSSGFAPSFLVTEHSALPVEETPITPPEQEQPTDPENPSNNEDENVDTDGDGLKDQEEDLNKNGWLDFNETDPTKADTDNDGITDFLEKTLDKDGDGFTDLAWQDLDNGDDCSPPSDKTDLDCDGFINARDIDSDNDGCLDADENKDGNHDDILDAWDAAVKTCGATNSSAPSSAPTPTNGGSTSQSQSEPETALPSEVVPAKGGGACQLMPAVIARSDSGEAISFWQIPFFSLIAFLLLIGGLRKSYR